MDAIGPGDWVECIDASPNSFGEPVQLKLGAVYRVEAIVKARSAQGIVADCALVDAVADLHERDGRLWLEAYVVDRFRLTFGHGDALLKYLMRPLAEPVPASS